MKNLIQPISNLFHPLLSMSWATVMLVLFSPLNMLPAYVRAFMVAEVTFFSFILPCLLIVLMCKLGIVKNGFALRDRKDRIIPLGIQMLLYWVQYLALSNQGLPEWALVFYKGACLLSVFFFVVTIWWKMSGHAGSNAALATAALILYYEFPMVTPLALPILLIIVTGAVGSIRIYLGRHTLEQVSIGALAGSLSMIIPNLF